MMLFKVAKTPITCWAGTVTTPVDGGLREPS